MNRIKYYLILVLMFSLSLNSFSQTYNDFGIWTSVGLQKRSGNWNFESELELRTWYNTQKINRISLGLDASYSILKPLKVGIGYQFIDYNDVSYKDFQPRHRFSLFATGSQKIGRFNLSLRERIQVTTKDESDRIKSNGEINTYKINPAWIWRNRLKVTYNVRKVKLNPYASFESFRQLNNPSGNVFNDLRYTIGVDYVWKKANKFDLYYLIDNEINVNEPLRRYVVGLGYTYSF